MVVRSPAKINLFLYVTGKKDNGYHELFTLMVRVGIHDRLTFDFNNKGIKIRCKDETTPEDDTNLAYRAADIFYKKSGIESSVSIELEKRIPVGAGLGGGSGNAATVLKTLNNHYGKPLDDETLITAGLEIGADVPFFLFNSSAIAEGIGEKLKPCILKKYHVVIIFPGVFVSTATIFRNLNLTLTKSSKKIKELLLWERKQNFSFDVCDHLWNDLEVVTEKICTQITHAKNALLKSGALNTLMTGSGSAVFGLFKDEESAKKGFDFLNRTESDTHKNWQIFQTEFEENAEKNYTGT